MSKLRSAAKQSQSRTASVSPHKAAQNSDTFHQPPLMDFVKVDYADASLSRLPSTSITATMEVDFKPSLDVKPMLDVKPDLDASPSQSPTLGSDMPPPKFKSSPTPTPPPTTTNGTNSATMTPPPSTPSINSRKAATTAPPQLIGDLPVARAQALSTFNEIPDNNYQYKTLGRSREALESMTCDCTYDHGVDNPGHACGPDSDCINRLTQVECLPDDCRCRSYCQNQRFQRKDYANIDIVLTEKKGFGLRAEADLPRDTFIYEYVGDVVNPISFKKRMRDYAQEGIQHFYFMMLQKDEFIDATKNGGIGRFANHSCNPNCYVAKWTVGDYVRMGIFTKRNIRKHEELTFNYNVDRYGHQAQICYCGEPNCVGYIGGKTQTDIATMDDLYLDALGITDEEDLMELKGTKKKKGKKIDDPDFMPTLKAIVEKDVPKVVQAIRQTQSRKVLSKLLTRIKITEDQAALRQIMRLRGYSLMTNVLQDYASDLELVALALECMSTWPLLNRNKVEDSKVIVPVQACTALGNEAVKILAQNLIDHWETLPLYNRIPKRLKQDGDGEEVNVIPLYDTPEPPSKRSKYEFEGPSIGITPLGTTANATFEAPAKPRESEDEARAKAVAILRAREVQNRQSIQAIIASAAEAAATEEAAAIAAAAVAKAKAEAAEEKVARRKNRPPKKVQTVEEKEANKEKRLLKLVGAVVVKCMSKYSKSMDHDLFKKHAKELTQIIADKEKKSSSYKEGRLDSLSDEKAAKIKKFAKEYIAKIIRRLEKSGQRAQPTTQATPSTSMNTPNSADGDGVMETEMTVEEAMGMDADSGSDGEGDVDERDISGNGQAGIADSSPLEMTVSADMANEPMDISESYEQALLPADPRRRPPADELAN